MRDAMCAENFDYDTKITPAACIEHVSACEDSFDNLSHVRGV